MKKNKISAWYVETPLNKKTMQLQNIPFRRCTIDNNNFKIDSYELMQIAKNQALWFANIIETFSSLV